MLLFPLLGGFDSNLLKADLGMGATYASDQNGALAELTLTIGSDGTWAFTVGAGDTLSGSPTSGTWHRIPATGVGTGYEVLIEVTNEIGTPTITNGAATYTSLASPVTVKIEKNGNDASADFTVSIRLASAPGTVLSDTYNGQANGSP